MWSIVGIQPMKTWMPSLLLLFNENYMLARQAMAAVLIEEIHFCPVVATVIHLTWSCIYLCAIKYDVNICQVSTWFYKLNINVARIKLWFKKQNIVELIQIFCSSNKKVWNSRQKYLKKLRFLFSTQNLVPKTPADGSGVRGCEHSAGAEWEGPEHCMGVASLLREGREHCVGEASQLRGISTLSLSTHLVLSLSMHSKPSGQVAFSVTSPLWTRN